jgi:hypothetical protein
MMDSAILFTWTQATPGREAKALEAFTEAMAFFGTAAHEGRCGDLVNFMGPSGHSYLLIPGEYEALWNLIRTDEFRDLFIKALYAAPDTAYELGAYGQGVQDLMARWAKVGKDLALI